MKSKNLKAIWLRIISAICIFALCITFFVGCTDITLTEDLAQREEELSNASGELASLKKDYNATLDENKTLNAENEAAKQEIEALKKSNEAANQEIGSLKANNEAAKKELEALKSENKKVNNELAELKSSNETAQKEIEDLKKQLEDLLNYVTPDSSEEKIRIYIDQGHNPTNYHNSGSQGNGLYEENITFTIGRLLAGLLTLDERFEVRLSRPTSSTVLGTTNTGSLEARVQGAKDFDADYFISLHVNAYTDSSAHGIEVYTTESSGTSYEFGSYLLDGVVESTQLRNRHMKQNPNLHVLKNATMPAVLIEMGFISNENDAKLLSESPELFAQGIYNGILNYFSFTKNN